MVVVGIDSVVCSVSAVVGSSVVVWSVVVGSTSVVVGTVEVTTVVAGTFVGGSPVEVRNSWFWIFGSFNSSISYSKQGRYYKLEIKPCGLKF